MSKIDQLCASRETVIKIRLAVQFEGKSLLPGSNAIFCSVHMYFNFEIRLFLNQCNYVWRFNHFKPLAFMYITSACTRYRVLLQ